MIIKPGKFTITTADGNVHVTEVEFNTQEIPVYIKPRVYLTNMLSQTINHLESEGTSVESVRVDYYE